MTELTFVSNVFDTFRRRGCPSLAASLAFYSILSLFPMVFLLLYGISFIVSQDVIGYQFLLGFLKGFLPSVGERLAKDSRMRKTSAGGVLASLSGSPYGGSTIRHVARCGLAGRPLCASCGVFCYRYGA
jgi:uncharacterized BrkB/YihY/UPF0761 family membrane protein